MKPTPLDEYKRQIRWARAVNDLFADLELPEIDPDEISEVAEGIKRVEENLRFPSEGFLKRTEANIQVLRKGFEDMVAAIKQAYDNDENDPATREKLGTLLQRMRPQ